MKASNLFTHLLLFLLLPSFLFAQSNQTDITAHSDYKAVHKAVENYVDALYNADETLIAESVDTTLRKIGYWYNDADHTFVDNLPMTYEQLYKLAKEWNVTGTRTNEQSPKEITIFDIQNKTASAKLVAVWGMDYFQLSKVDGKWKIVNVMWQSLLEGRE